MRTSVLIAAIVTVAAGWSLSDPAAAQQQRPEVACAGKALSMFGSTGRPPLTVRRDGADVFKMQIVPGLIVTICYDQLGPDGELTGDIAIRTHSPSGSARLQMTINDAA